MQQHDDLNGAVTGSSQLTVQVAAKVVGAGEVAAEVVDELGGANMVDDAFSGTIKVEGEGTIKVKDAAAGSVEGADMVAH